GTAPGQTPAAGRAPPAGGRTGQSRAASGLDERDDARGEGRTGLDVPDVLPAALTEVLPQSLPGRLITLVVRQPLAGFLPTGCLALQLPRARGQVGLVQCLQGGIDGEDYAATVVLTFDDGLDSRDDQPSVGVAVGLGGGSFGVEGAVETNAPHL